LSQLDRIILVMYYRLRHPDDPPLIALDQGPEGLRVPIPGPLEQFGFVGVGAQGSTQLG
jgi:hypothetical protein